jgi:Zn-dependent protease with chaperone function
MNGKTPSLVTPKERLYYALLVVVSLAIYGALGAALYLSPEIREVVLPMLVYIPVFAIAVFFARGMMMGHLRGNAIHVTQRQFPKLHEAAKKHAAAIGLKNLPEVFVMQSGGLLNAFATRFLGRDFVVIYSDVLALAEERGEAAVGFIVAHELAHLKRGHLKHRWLTNPGRLVPYLSAAYSRACEYTCDRFGAHYQPDGAVDGLLVLAAGRDLYRSVDAREYVKQVETQKGFFVNRAELMSSHPFLPKRVAAVIKQGAAMPAKAVAAVKAPAYSPVTPVVPHAAVG